jgi:hypothetical protein
MAAVGRLASIALIAEVLANHTRPGRSYWRNLSKTARGRKVITTDEAEKNRLWFVIAFGSGTEKYLSAFRQLRRGEFYKGWCTLEEAEIIFARQEENAFISDLKPLVEQRAHLIALWQSAFPYRYFVSPGMILKRWACSICGKQGTPVEPCGHVPNRVYGGELCYRRILDFQAREVSIVTEPVQKYSVLQLDYDYSVVRYVLDHLSGPFHPWSGEWTYKRQPHGHFADRQLDGPCPCDSSLRYSECCRHEVGVKLPHFQMIALHGPQRGTFEDQLVLQSKNERSLATSEERTFRAAILKAGA